MRHDPTRRPLSQRKAAGEVMLNIISLGAGVQSSTMALMAAHGEITPMPDCAIFADTGAEPKAVYDYLYYLQERLPFKIYRVSAGNLADDLIAGVNSTGQKFSPVPWHMAQGIGRRQCTREYKLAPIYKKIRELRGVSKESVRVWVGISVDESHRAKPAQVKYITNVFPLLDKGMYRLNCLNWMRQQAHQTPPRSACVFCPYHDNKEFSELKENDKPGWEMAVKVDAAIRASGESQFAHRSLVPLADADLTAPDKDQLSMFGNECEGMCGV